MTSPAICKSYYLYSDHHLGIYPTHLLPAHSFSSGSKADVKTLIMKHRYMPFRVRLLKDN